MSLEISPEVESVVRERAAAEGVSVEELLMHTFATERSVIQATSDPKERVRALLSKWQAEDNTPTLPPIPTQNGETPTQALFRKWDEEDARLSDAERKEETVFWAEFQESLNAERTKTGMRKLF